MARRWGEQEMAERTEGARPFPWITAAIITAWVLTFGAAWLVAGDRSATRLPSSLVARWGGNAAGLTMDGEWWRLLANKLLFFDVKSLAVIAWAFWGAGAVVERVFGRLGLLCVFLGGALASSLAALAFLPPNKMIAGGGAPTLAAFGAILGYVLAGTSDRLCD